MLDYGFQIGEEVIDTYGRKGKIVRVCKCEECKKRGFYEPSIQWDNSDNPWDVYIPSNISELHGFPELHSIGDRIFSEYDLNGAKREMERLRKEMIEVQKEIDFMSKAIELIESEQGKW